VVRDARARLGGRRAERTLEAQVPVAVDLLAVAIGSGCSPVAAVEVASRWAPPAVAARFGLVYRSFLMGDSFASAVARLGRPQTALGTLGTLGALLAEAGTLGSPMLAPLDRLATESRAAFRRRAEARARTVPVRLLFPLVFLVLPAFGLITVVPAIDAGLRGG
jgi:tight adherence protein C